MRGVSHLDRERAFKERTMSVQEERCTARRSSIRVDPEATANDLLSDAVEWLQYARGLTEFIGEMVHESDGVDCRKMALVWEAVGSVLHIGVQCTAQAHANLAWEQKRTTATGCDR
jgi:hypothetical protein